MDDRNDIDVEAFRARLLAERDELRRVAELGKESRRPVELDQTSVGRLSRMDAIRDQAMALETERRRAMERHRIDAALARIDEGEFGYCVTCGEEIPAKRLDLNPTAPVCVDCATPAKTG